jgi:hypothetical protein
MVREWMIVGLKRKNTTKRNALVKPLTKAQLKKRKEAKQPVPNLTWSLLNEEINFHHFSSIIMKNEDFVNIAKISIFGKCEPYFRQIFICNEEKLNNQFDNFCREITTTLAGIFDTMICQKQSKRGFYQRLATYLRSKQYEKSVIALPSEYKCEQTIGAVVLTLSDLILERLRSFREDERKKMSVEI